jgi:hypothetical protein
MRPFKSISGPGIPGVPLPGIELKRLFCFLDNRQGALADGLHGLNPRNTDRALHPAPADQRRLSDW